MDHLPDLAVAYLRDLISGLTETAFAVDDPAQFLISLLSAEWEPVHTQPALCGGTAYVGTHRATGDWLAFAVNPDAMAEDYNPNPTESWSDAHNRLNSRRALLIGAVSRASTAPTYLELISAAAAAHDRDSDGARRPSHHPYLATVHALLNVDHPDRAAAATLIALGDYHNVGEHLRNAWMAGGVLALTGYGYSLFAAAHSETTCHSAGCRLCDFTRDATDDLFDLAAKSVSPQTVDEFGNVTVAGQAIGDQFFVKRMARRVGDVEKFAAPTAGELLDAASDPDVTTIVEALTRLLPHWRIVTARMTRDSGHRVICWNVVDDKTPTTPYAVSAARGTERQWAKWTVGDRYSRLVDTLDEMAFGLTWDEAAHYFTLHCSMRSSEVRRVVQEAAELSADLSSPVPRQARSIR